MGLFSNLFDTEKTANMTITNPKQVFNEILKQSSGTNTVRDVKFNLFYQIFGFKGITDGLGVSTMVANTAIALAEQGLTICVIDTSILAPSQDILLKTDFENYDVKDRLDWFDMPFTKRSVLHISGYNKNISVLSFAGKGRTIVDFLSTNENTSLVDIALTQLHNKFDVILIDICNEPSNVATACLQQSQKIIQVWNDSPQVIRNIETALTNYVTLACPYDKMRNVVYSRMSKQTMGANLDELCKEFKLKCIARCFESEEINFNLVSGKALYQLASTNQDIIGYTNMIIYIMAMICNIDLNKRDDKNSKVKTGKGTISSQDIMDGKVEGTVTKKLKDRAKEQGFDTVTQIGSLDEIDDLLNK